MLTVEHQYPIFRLISFFSRSLVFQKLSVFYRISCSQLLKSNYGGGGWIRTTDFSLMRGVFHQLNYTAICKRLMCRQEPYYHIAVSRSLVDGFLLPLSQSPAYEFSGERYLMKRKERNTVGCQPLIFASYLYCLSEHLLVWSPVAFRSANRTFLPAFCDLGGTFAFPKVGRLLHRIATVDGGSSSLYIQQNNLELSLLITYILYQNFELFSSFRSS